jgi:hypothetical protein
VYYVNEIGGFVVGDSASAFLSYSKSGEPDPVTLKGVSVNEKVLIGIAGNFENWSCSN